MLCKGHYQLARKSEKKNMKFGVAPFSLPKKRLRGELILTSLRYLHNWRLSDNRGLLVYHTKAQVSAAGWIQSKIDSNREANPVLTITNYGNSFVKDMDGSVTKILKSKVSFYMILWNLSRNYELDTDVLEWNYLACVIQKVVLEQCLQRRVLWAILMVRWKVYCLLSAGPLPCWKTFRGSQIKSRWKPFIKIYDPGLMVFKSTKEIQSLTWT